MNTLSAAPPPLAQSSSLINDDLAPTSPARRTWTTYNYIALWFSMSMEVTTFMLASSLIAGGMNWIEALATVLLGNIIVLIPMLINAHAGAKYGIPFPVFVRSSFGIRGAQVPALLRAFVACGWFGIQCWIGGESIAALLHIVLPHSNPQQMLWGSFAAFWLLNMIVVFCGLEWIKRLQGVSAPFLLVTSLTLFAVMVSKAGGFGPILRQPSHFTSNTAFMSFFLFSLTGMVGNWATMALNISDFTRFAESEGSQIRGQAFGLPVAMTLFSFIGIVCTSASTVVFGKAIWNPVELLGRFDHPVFAGIATLSILLATLNVNLGANVVSPSNDFSNVAPRFISFRTGGLITGVLGLLIQPWRLLSSHTNYIGWLVSYSGLLGPIAGVMMVDYLFIRRRTLRLDDLYQESGAYTFYKGFNLRALVALLAGAVAAFSGAFIPRLHPLFAYSWFVGLFVSGALYLVLAVSDPEAQP